MVFTDGELAYLADQPLGRLATQQANGTLQVNPVSFVYNADRETIDIGGRDMENSRKFRNIAENGRVAFVVDDIASFDPWTVRCLEIRGHAEALPDPVDSVARTTGAIIRIHPQRIISWGIDPPHIALGRRNVGHSPPAGK